jgi:prepilin-type N-terminal cleavage/methylation domain-containing protein
MRARAMEGFTLIEVVVVVIIMGILVAIALPNVLGAQKKAKEAAVKSNMHGLQVVSESYATANSGSYAQTAADLAPFFPGGSNSIGGSAGTFPMNPSSGVTNQTPAVCSLTSLAAVTAARNQTSIGNLGGSAGQTAYNGIVDTTNANACSSYAITGNDDSSNTLRTDHGFLVLSNL